MFDVLLETRQLQAKTGRGMVASFAIHTASIGVAVALTAGVSEPAAPPEPPDIVIFTRTVAPPPPQVTPPVAASMVPPPPGFEILIAPVTIPEGLPEINLNARITDEPNYSGVPRLPGTSAGNGTTPPAGGPRTYFESQVEKPAALIAGTGAPVYPEMLKSAGIDGEVVVSFVIDSTGRADARTLEVIESTRPEFATAVRNALNQMRFLPAEVAGRKVRQLVRLPFQFTIR